MTKLQNRYTASPINFKAGDDIDFKQIRPTKPAYPDVTIKATASRPLIGPQRPKKPNKPINTDKSPVIKTPPLRPFVRYLESYKQVILSTSVYQWKLFMIILKFKAKFEQKSFLVTLKQ